ncbi:TetR/AcrR family transcriptional regulator [Sinimarinibacterium sp. CAU 1509]|uniref:TetR/AcrR family transcriptional regulator n=1 Tax=Sinimarinibacterium sp. CAU 1509 TaxID=2562283 RepID=UPI0010AC10BE|nr:TetR/AcrR family transcriptional regulator [Sinimarinibacterium sp. CAU 1509]TJY62982.1 TetR/AcrR family transcriptional regulator [Sinimarinibacterium sp. CAU 1509]
MAVASPPGTPRKPSTKSAAAATPRPRRGYAGRSADQLAAERHERLLEAAIELFATRGYHHTPIEALCAQARVTTRHFYEAFGSREALLMAAFDLVIAHTQQVVLQTLDDHREAPPEVAIEAAIRAFVRAYTDDPRYARIACLEVVGVSEAVAVRRSAVIHEFVRLVELYAEDLAARGLLLRRDFHLAGVAVAGASNELLSEWLRAPQPPDLDVVTDEILLLFRAAIMGVGPGVASSAE